MSMASGMAMLGRVTAESLMESSCIITRKTGETVDASGANVSTFTTIYSGKCRLRMDTRRADEVVASYSLLATMGLLTAQALNLRVQIYDPTAYYNLVDDAPTANSAQGQALDRVLQAIGGN